VAIYLFSKNKIDEEDPHLLGPDCHSSVIDQQVNAYSQKSAFLKICMVFKNFKQKRKQGCTGINRCKANVTIAPLNIDFKIKLQAAIP